MRIYVRDLRASGICLAGGARPWWKRRDLDWNDFLKNGIDADRLLATGDAQAERVVAEAKARRAKEEDHGRRQ